MDSRVDDDNDLIWGAAAIARELGCKRSTVYYLLKTGVLQGCVKKLGFKTIVASRRALQKLTKVDAAKSNI